MGGGLHQLYRDILALKEGDGRVEPPTMPALAPTEERARRVAAAGDGDGGGRDDDGAEGGAHRGALARALAADRRAVAEANETLGIDPVGSIAQQVEVLMSECSLDGHA